jgi:hypothetical protein
MLNKRIFISSVGEMPPRYSFLIGVPRIASGERSFSVISTFVPPSPSHHRPYLERRGRDGQEPLRVEMRILQFAVRATHSDGG